MIHFLLLVSRQGKIRLSRWYSPSLFVGQTPNNTYAAISSSPPYTGLSTYFSFSASPQSSGGNASGAKDSRAAASSSSITAGAATTKNGGDSITGGASGLGAATTHGGGGASGGGGSRGGSAATTATLATAASGSSGTGGMSSLGHTDAYVRRGFPAIGRQKRGELLREAASKVLQRSAKMCNVVEWREDTRLVYKRYASLFFIACIDSGDNPLLTLEIIHHFVEILDSYFGNVCELDLIFNFHKAYYLLDETICAGELQESSKKVVLRVINAQDALMEESHEKGGGKLT